MTSKKYNKNYINTYYFIQYWGLNLIIARMSATFTSVDEKSVGQFHLSKADIVKRFLPIYESHPFCMLPAPLNAFLVVTCVVDFIIYKCTVCDKLF